MRRALACTIACATLASGCSDKMRALPRLGEASAAVSVGEVAAAFSCDSSGVAALDLQIIAQANCASPGAYVALPAFANVNVVPGVHAFLEQPALDALTVAVNTNSGMSLQINSALRTVAEQYVLAQWVGNCGITAAASPGQSNHESGLALDIQQYDAWRPALEAQGFAWLGSGDPWHFDYAGPGAVDHRGEDVLAFQVLWNHNHPEDLIDADGVYGPQTEARLAQAPAEGFPSVPRCGGSVEDTPDVWLTSEVTGASDTFADGSSQGAIDLFEDDAALWVIEVENRGTAAATSVTVSLDGGDALEPSAFTVERALPDAEPEPDGEGTFDGGAAEVILADLLPGEVAIVRVEARAGAYSVEAAEAVTARAFVREVEGHYTAADWGVAPDNDGTQTFGGGTLQLELAADVYSHVRWELESDRLEGMSGANALDAPSDGVLEIPEAEAAFLMTPATDVEGTAKTRLWLRVRREGGEGEAAVYVFDDADLEPFDDAALPARVAIDLPADGEMHEIFVDPEDAPALAGPIARVAFVPFAGGSGTAAMDFMRITGVVTDPGDPDGVGDVDAGASCSCRMAPQGPAPQAYALMALAIGALLRRRRSTPG
jgi:MYXO-CTERM domain-containing protein